jgi:hypothetical protein
LSEVNPDRPLVVFAVVLLGLLLAYLGVRALSAQEGTRLLNGAGPLSLLAASLWTAYVLTARSPRLIWTPVPWFLGASAMYCGLGPLVYTVGDEETIRYIDTLWPVGPDELWRTNVLNRLGVLTVTAGLLAGNRLLRTSIGAGYAPVRAAPAGGPRAAVFLFLTIGLPVHYLLALPYELGQLGFTLPGSIYTLEGLVPLGLFILSYLAVRHGRGWAAVFVALLCAETVVAFLRFNKFQLILVLMMAALGHYYASRRITRLFISGLLIACVYGLLVPVVSWGRATIDQETRTGRSQGTIAYHASLADRLRIVQEGGRRWLDGSLSLDQKQGWLARLCYANAQAFAMHRYDTGYPGQSYRLAFCALVPRLVWPDRPTRTDDGVDFSELSTGARERATSIGIGIFGEAYWAGGWPVVCLVSAAVGLLFAWLSSAGTVRRGGLDWLLLQCALLAIKMGFRIDGWLVADYIGSTVIYLGYYLTIRLFWATG